MKGWAASCALLGCVMGVSMAGFASDCAGRKKTLVLSGLLFLASAIGTAIAQSFTAFVVYRIIGGVGVGVASMASPMYIAELSPAKIRGRMVSVNQLAIVSGIGLAAMGAAFQLHAVAGCGIVFTLGYIASFAASVAPVTWVILSEIFPNSIRGKAMSLATLGLWTANFIVSQTFPMLDENAWLVARFNHAFPFYLYAVFCVMLVGIVWLAVPETKGRSLEEIELYWTR